MAMTSQWFCIYTNPNSEGRALASLQAKGFYTFMPTVRRYVKSGRVRRVSERALFTRYLFVLVRPGQVRAEIRNCHGVQTIIGGAEPGSPPQAIPDSAVDYFMQLDDAGYFDETAKEAAKTQREELKGVLNGPLATLAERLRKAKDDERIAIMLHEAGLIDQRVAA